MANEWVTEWLAVGNAAQEANVERLTGYYSRGRPAGLLGRAEMKLLQFGRPQALVVEASARHHVAEQVVLFRLQAGTVTTQVISPSAWRHLVQGHAMQAAVATADLPHARIQDLGVHSGGGRWLRCPDVWTSSTGAAGAAEGASATVLTSEAPFSGSTPSMSSPTSSVATQHTTHEPCERHC